MKKFLSILGVVLILAVCLILPVSASSPTVILQPPSFEPPFINNYPIYLDRFSLVDPDANNGLYWTRSELLTCLNADDNSESVTLYFMFLDSDHNLLDINSFALDVWRNGVFQETINSSHNYIIFNPRDYLASYAFSLSITSSVSSAQWCCVIPLYTVDTDLISSLISTYQGSFFNRLTYEQGYNAGFDSGGNATYQQGKDAGYELGKQEVDSAARQEGFDEGYDKAKAEWYQKGKNDAEAWTNDKDISHTILYVVSSPFIAISNFLDFTVLGINFRVIFAFVVGALIIAFVIRHFVK